MIPSTFGRMWRKMIRRSPAPVVRAASTNSRFRIVSTSPRTMRAIVSHCTMPRPTKTGSAEPRAAEAKSSVMRMTRNM